MARSARNKKTAPTKTKAKESAPLAEPLAAIGRVNTQTSAPAAPTRKLLLTLDNHFEFGYDGKPFTFRTSPEQRWWVAYGSCKRWAMDFRSECVVAARQIRASTDRDIWVCLSGGIDSEVVAESFRYARVPFRAAIMRFKHDLNIHDISFAVAYCETHDIRYEFFDIDIHEFFNSGEMSSLAELTNCPSPMLPSSMKLMELVSRRGGYPVLGSGECYLQKHKDQWYFYEREKIASLYRFLLKSNIPGQAGFFQWNPEIMFSFLADPMISRLVDGKIPLHSSTYYLKPDMYAQHFNLRPRIKYTGFEKVWHLDTKWRPVLEHKFREYNQEAHILYSDLTRALRYVDPITKTSTGAVGLPESHRSL